MIHKNDRPRVARRRRTSYDLVQAGDLFEWRQASDCFVRYTVTDVKDDPAGDPPRKLLAVAWMTYAFTGLQRRDLVDRHGQPAVRPAARPGRPRA